MIVTVYGKDPDYQASLIIQNLILVDVVEELKELNKSSIKLLTYLSMYSIIISR